MSDSETALEKMDCASERFFCGRAKTAAFVANALPSFPIVLCLLIRDYVCSKAYEWQDFDTVLRISDGKDADQFRSHTQTKFTEGSKFGFMHSGGRHFMPYTFVSNVTLREGARKWTITWKPVGDMNYLTVSCGVTTSAQHNFQVTWDPSIRRAQITIYGRHGHVNYQKAERTTPYRLPPSLPEYLQSNAGFEGEPAVDFIAIPITRQVIARLRGQNKGYILLTCKSEEEYLSLRPCLQLSESAEVLILSNVNF